MFASHDIMYKKIFVRFRCDWTVYCTLNTYTPVFKAGLVSLWGLNRYIILITLYLFILKDLGLSLRSIDKINLPIDHPLLMITSIRTHLLYNYDMNIRAIWHFCQPYHPTCSFWISPSLYISFPIYILRFVGFRASPHIRPLII